MRTRVILTALSAAGLMAATLGAAVAQPYGDRDSQAYGPGYGMMDGYGPGYGPMHGYGRGHGWMHGYGPGYRRWRDEGRSGADNDGYGPGMMNGYGSGPHMRGW